MILNEINYEIFFRGMTFASYLSNRLSNLIRSGPKGVAATSNTAAGYCNKF